MVLTEITYFMILGKPLIFYLGVISFILLLTTSIIGYLNYKRKINLPFKWHLIFAALTIIVAITHAILGIAIYI